jgi:L-ascorbate metabolism protein UlaG (beta-lactamase superfamily)
MTPLSKRQFIKTVAAAGSSTILSLAAVERAFATVRHVPPEHLARRDDFWDGIRAGYTLSPDFIQLENGFKIYHMGDTGLFGDMKMIGEYYKPDLLLVPIGGHYVMNPKDAAYATKELIKPKMAWPMHYASNPFLKGTPAEYKAALGPSSVQVIDAEPGTKKTF